MRWPFMLKSTHEQILEKATNGAVSGLDVISQKLLRQRDETRAAQRGLRRLQKKMKKMEVVGQDES